ncbi:bifunctional DNA primase/polymerase [Geothrix sp. 21YS21S-2]|uniref:bifunctional DNA primase/polymerase n=1 Tax=Geothrix sp. 21YS21S-2 TaxID=3068893 RepID=UPI0027B90C63|nr:bifunctional DNA primase/polymerase [Geothrix sp. 21YS21S-2]
MGSNKPNVFEFLEGLARFKVVFVKLAPGQKHTIGGWEPYINAHEQHGASRLDHALQWLDKGFGLGFLPRNRLWAVDLDRSITAPGLPMLERLEDFQVETMRFGPRVTTPSGGQHVYFRLPEEIDMGLLKNHVCHPKDEYDIPQEWDFKLGPRTLMVAPGTSRTLSDGSTTSYRPATLWIEPPVCDPRWIVPGLPILNSPPEPFTFSQRSLEDRIVRAVAFLRKRAQRSVRHSGGGGHYALWQVAVHLVAYLRLDPGLAVNLLTHPEGQSWNDRSVDMEGRRAPWSVRELYAACSDAVDDAPPFGIKEYKELQARGIVQARLDDFTDLLNYLPFSDERMFSLDLYRIFLELADLEEDECSSDRFGKAVGTAIRQGVTSVTSCQMLKSRTRAYRGVSESMILRALHDREELRLYFDRVA